MILCYHICVHWFMLLKLIFTCPSFPSWQRSIPAEQEFCHRVNPPQPSFYINKIKNCLGGIHIFLLRTELHKSHDQLNLKGSSSRILPHCCPCPAHGLTHLVLTFLCSYLWETQACSHPHNLARTLNYKRLGRERERPGSPTQLLCFGGLSNLPLYSPFFPLLFLPPLLPLIFLSGRLWQTPQM